MGKIFRSNVRKISANKFREAALDDGKVIKGEKLKKYVEKITQGGITETALEKKLRDSGLIGSRYGQRKRLMGVITEREKVSKEKPRVSRSLMALDTSGIPEELTARQAKSIRNIERAQQDYIAGQPQPEPRAGRRISALGGGQSGLAGQAGNLNHPNPLTNPLPPPRNIGGSGRPFIPLQR